MKKASYAIGFSVVLIALIAIVNNANPSTPQSASLVQSFTASTTTAPLATTPSSTAQAALQPCPSSDPLGLSTNCQAQTSTNPNDPLNVRPATPTSTTSQSGLSNDNHYQNSEGESVHSPAYSNTVPAGATAQCSDGTYSFSEHRQGTCSHHGGVMQWLY